MDVDGWKGGGDLRDEEGAIVIRIYGMKKVIFYKKINRK